MDGQWDMVFTTIYSIRNAQNGKKIRNKKVNTNLVNSEIVAYEEANSISFTGSKIM
jgi:hypothetical protein